MAAAAEVNVRVPPEDGTPAISETPFKSMNAFPIIDANRVWRHYLHPPKFVVMIRHTLVRSWKAQAHTLVPAELKAQTITVVVRRVTPRSEAGNFTPIRNIAGTPGVGVMRRR